MPAATRTGRPFGAAISVLLIVCAILTAVSAWQANRLDAPDDGEAMDSTDIAAPMRQMLRRLDQVRGLEALHLLVGSSAEQRALESEIAAQRRAIAATLARCRTAADDGVDLALGAAVRAGFTAYWGLQDRLLAVSRRALADRAAAGEARQLFDRDAQAIVDRLRDQLDRWWSHRETRLREALQARSAGAARALWLVAFLGALTLAIGALLGWWWRKRPNAIAATAMAPAGDQAATASRVQEVQALIDAVRSEAAPASRHEAGPVQSE